MPFLVCVLWVTINFCISAKRWIAEALRFMKSVFTQFFITTCSDRASFKRLLAGPSLSLPNAKNKENTFQRNLGYQLHTLGQL